MKKFIFLLVFCFYCVAEEIKIMVKGMVCDFCVTTLEKEFKKHKSVETVKVSLSEKYIQLSTYKKLDITDEEITKIVNNNGYNIEKIIR